jgi:hypothetical protein
VCARIGNQWSRGVVTTRVRTDTVRSLRHQHRNLHQLTYHIPLRRSGLILLSRRAPFYVALCERGPLPQNGRRPNQGAWMDAFPCQGSPSPTWGDHIPRGWMPFHVRDHPPQHGGITFPIFSSLISTSQT